MRMKFMQVGCLDKRLTLFLTYLVIIFTFAFIATLLLYQPSESLTQDEEYLDLSYEFKEPSQNLDDNLIIGSQNKNRGPVHLAIVNGGFNSTRNLYLLLKSILFYRTDPICLHLFVDQIAKTILTKLFDTWQVSELQVNFYNITLYEVQVSWISNRHYSHRFGLMKLVFLTVLLENRDLSKVIFLDSDMLVLGNINRLWAEFEKFNKNPSKDKSVFGMVENQSDWYLDNGRPSGAHVIWPAIGRGFNSGLLLVDLSELRNLKWQETWHNIAELELISHLTTSLADQDIFNAVIKSHSYMVHVLPCHYNLQLNDHTDLDQACPEINTDFKVVHWNSPYKLSTKNRKSEYFRNWYLTFRNWDGNLLKRTCCGEPSNKTELEQEISNEFMPGKYCGDIQPSPEKKLRTLLYFSEFELEQTQPDVTFVVHLSLDRLQVLDQLAMHWKGPISAAIYLPELETNLLMASIENSNNLVQRKNIGYHLVFRDYGFNYPINRLRNIALNNVLTPYVFLSDIDFLPSTNLYDYLRKSISDLSANQKGDSLEKRALVIPAFENLQYKFDFPSTKAELLKQMNIGSISMFREQIWPQGHSPTEYSKWKVSTRPYRVAWKPEYEPFIVTSKSVPRFDERFVGFGWNKVEHIMQLAALEYEFIVLPEAFVIHLFHQPSYDILKHRESLKYRVCIRQLRRTFLSELRSSFPRFFGDFIKATSQPGRDRAKFRF